MNRVFSRVALSATIVGLGYAQSAMATDESFNATMTLLAPIVITETQALSFPATTTGANTVVVAAADATAATFTATGEASTAVTASVVEASINMTNGGSTIPVDTWTFGGTLTDAGGSGTASFSGAGSLGTMRVGATATIDGTDIAGAYTGTATFRLIY